MRTIILSVLVVLGACSDRAQSSVAGSASAPGSSSVLPGSAPTPVASPSPAASPPPGTLPAPAPAAAPTASAPPPDACALACAHRIECLAPGGDVAGCTADCRGVQGVFQQADLEMYPRLSCDQVRELEPVFRAAVSCRRLCTHRASCVPDATDVDACVDACTTLGPRANELEAKYITSDCAVASEMEPAFERTRACVAACRHARECGIPDEFPVCLKECESGLAGGTIDPGVLAELTAADCQTLAQRLARPPAPAAPARRAAPSISGGGTMADCRRVGGSVVGGVCSTTFACRKLGCPVGWTCGIEGFCHHNQYSNCMRCP